MATTNPYQAPQAKVADASTGQDPIEPLARIRGWYIFLGITAVLHAILTAFQNALLLAEWSQPVVAIQIFLGFLSVILLAWIGVLQMQAGSCLRRDWIEDEPDTVLRGAKKLALSIVLMGLLWVLTIASTVILMAAMWDQILGR